MNIWTLKQYFSDDKIPENTRNLIQLGDGWLHAVPSEVPGDRMSKHTPFRGAMSLLFNGHVFDFVDRLPRWPFVFETYKMNYKGHWVFLFVWGGLDSQVAHYSLRVYATNKAEPLTGLSYLRFGAFDLYHSFFSNKTEWASGMEVFDAKISPLPDDGGGFGDFGIFALPDLGAHFSGEEIFDTFEFFNAEESLYSTLLPAGLFKQKNQNTDDWPYLEKVTPFIHPKKWISPLRPAQTGDQDSFGVWKGFATDPLSMLRLASYEAHRPCHWFEDDGSFVRAKDHPNLVIYDGKPHWRKAVSPDQLGRKKFVVRNGWENHDDQHNEEIDGSFMQAAIRNTGDPSLIHEAQMMAQRWISRLTIKKNWSTSDPLTGRAAGRVFKTLAYLISVLPKRDAEELRQAIDRRLTAIENDYYGLIFDAQGKVKYLRTIFNDQRVFRANGGWIVWEDALAVAGMYMLGKALPDDRLVNYSFELANSIVDYGTDPRTGRIFAHVMIDPTMKDGVPQDWLPPLDESGVNANSDLMNYYLEIGVTPPKEGSVLSVPGNDKIHLDTGTDFTTWAIPCFKIVALAGNKRGQELYDKWTKGREDQWRVARWMGI